MDNTEKAILLLREMNENQGRIPQKSDFDSDTVCFIKQKLGPWPRAIEKAGLKPVKSKDK